MRALIFCAFACKDYTVSGLMLLTYLLVRPLDDREVSGAGAQSRVESTTLP